MIVTDNITRTPYPDIERDYYFWRWSGIRMESHAQFLVFVTDEGEMEGVLNGATDPRITSDPTFISNWVRSNELRIHLIQMLIPRVPCGIEKVVDVKRIWRAQPNPFENVLVETMEGQFFSYSLREDEYAEARQNGALVYDADEHAEALIQIQ